MKVKNIIKKSAEFLRLENVVRYLNDQMEITSEIDQEIKDFLIAINMVNNNIASSYLELIDVVEIVNRKGEISFNDISQNPIIEIKNVCDFAGNDISYKLLSTGLKVSEVEHIKVTYSYFPQEVGVDDDIDYYLKINDLVFAIGVVGEYLYIKGAIDEASIWDKRFKQTMFNLIRPKRNIVIPAKRWE